MSPSVSAQLRERWLAEVVDGSPRQHRAAARQRQRSPTTTSGAAEPDRVVGARLPGSSAASRSALASRRTIRHDRQLHAPRHADGPHDDRRSRRRRPRGSRAAVCRSASAGTPRRRSSGSPGRRRSARQRPSHAGAPALEPVGDRLTDVSGCDQRSAGTFERSAATAPAGPTNRTAAGSRPTSRHPIFR